MPKTTEKCRKKLREEFLKNKDITDLRIIDMLAIDSQKDLKDSICLWKQKSQLLKYWDAEREPKQTKFLAKFLVGKN